ncbi:hypothetical protein AURDEDRAFT_187377 [Auricularia subglabra TFB-10046 SS5]|nr:hypothetical protein AURDEDRAFT_187377 [Auricularia subglabra TFB-10046 SS5]
MLLVENPSIYDRPVEFGTLVVVSLDPVASVAALDDEQATAEAAAIVPGKYLALVDLPGEMVYSSVVGGVQLALCFLLAGPGLPSPPYSKAAVPIAPTPPHLDLERPPARASRPLPWADYYFHTLEYLHARVSRIYQHAQAGPSFTDDEFDEIKYASGMDARAYPRFGHDTDDEVDCDGSTVSRDGPILDDARGHDECQSAGPYDPMVFPIQFKEGRSEMFYHVQMWVDITAFEHLDRPENLHAEQRRLHQIERDWARRTIRAMISKEPQTTAWLESAAGADAPDACDDNSSVNTDDDLVGPEDAIEHRLERSMIDGEDPGLPTRLEMLRETPSVQDFAENNCDGALRTAVSSSESDASGSIPASRISDAEALARRSTGTLSVLRYVLSNVGAWVSCSLSFFWGILWRNPFSRPHK